MSTHTLGTYQRVLPAHPYLDLETYMDRGGGRGLTAARSVEPDVVIAELEASGLRGRGGAGFPIGTKWRTVASYASSVLDTSVVVNAAEGEPGTYKDRAILQSNPYAVVEGALIAAHAMGARSITVATKERFGGEIDRLHRAIAEMRAAGWFDDVSITVVEGPGEYLFGEETALLEVLDGRPPFPRIAPPWRRGVVEVVASDDDVASGSGLAADVEMATPVDNDGPPPVLVNNVETLANVPAIIADGAEWFRSVGTEQSPGTIVCTVTGAVDRPIVVEVAMGTRLRDVLGETTSDDNDAPSIAGVMMGVSNALLSGSALDTPISYEAFASAGTGLGSASFIVLGADDDGVAVAAGASRFLAVESCGQCEACKHDGLQISDVLSRLCANEADEADVDAVRMRLTTITDGARCNLASQHQLVVGSLLNTFDAHVRGHLDRSLDPTDRAVVAEVLRIDGGSVTLDPSFVDKQPDWTYEAVDSGESPVERLADHRAEHPVDENVGHDAEA